MTSTTDPAARDAIRAFILSVVPLPDLSDDEPLFASGIVNSLFAVELMTFLEKHFGIVVGADDLEMENFQSIQAAAEFVQRKQLSSAA